MTWLEDLDQVAKEVTCNLLKNDGVNAGLWAAVGAGVLSPEPASSVAGAVAGLGLIALQNGCEYDPNSGTQGTPTQKGCAEIAAGGYGYVYRIRPNGSDDLVTGFMRITSMNVSGPYKLNDRDTVVDLNIVEENVGPSQTPVLYGDGDTFELRPQEGSECARQSKGIVPNPPGQLVTGATTNCTFNVEFQSWWTGPEGVVEPVYKISSANQLRSEEEVIGGCNFNPIIVVGGGGGGRIGGGPPAVGPWNPDWDVPGPDGQPPWGEFLSDLITGVAGVALYEQLAALLEKPWAGTEYRINPSCPSSGSDPELPVVVEIPALKGEDAILTRLDALVPLLQAQKDLKQPICRDKPTLEGEWRTISFRSEQTSPFGKSRLRKRFRYRSVSGIGLEQLVDYWADFSFDAGPVIVIHKGASWGTPQVWAATADEGKRVIRHAAGEAGLDPDQVGQWEVSSSRSARYGVSGTMKVDVTGGYYWITERDGSNGRPVVCRL